MCEDYVFKASFLLNVVVLRSIQGRYTQCDLYSTILLYYYAETKELIYKSVNLKGVVYN